MDDLDQLLETLEAPREYYDLSADAAGSGSLAGLDDSFFDAEHPLHEAGPPAPLRPLLVGSPAPSMSLSERVEAASAPHVSPVRGAAPPPPPRHARRSMECGKGGSSRAGRSMAKRSTGAAGLQTPEERQVERAMRGRRIESPAAAGSRLRPCGGRSSGRERGGGAAAAAPAAAGQHGLGGEREDLETRNLLAELEQHNKRVVEAAQLAAKERVRGSRPAGACALKSAVAKPAHRAGPASVSAASKGRGRYATTPPTQPTPTQPTPTQPQPPPSPPSSECAVGCGSGAAPPQSGGPSSPRGEAGPEPVGGYAGREGEVEVMEVDEGEGEVEGEGETKASRASRSKLDAELDAVSASLRRVSTAALGVPPPAEFVCPITRSLMREPVFERAAIERWFRRHNTNPLTGEALQSTVLVPNLPLASLIAVHAASLPAKTVQFSGDAAAALGGGAAGKTTPFARRANGSSTGGRVTGGGTGGTGRPRSTGGSLCDQTPTASTRAAPPPQGAAAALEEEQEEEQEEAAVLPPAPPPAAPPPATATPAAPPAAARAPLRRASRKEGPAPPAAPPEPPSPVGAPPVSDGSPGRTAPGRPHQPPASCTCTPTSAGGAPAPAPLLTAQPLAAPTAGGASVAAAGGEAGAAACGRAAPSRREELEAWRRERDARRERERAQKGARGARGGGAAKSGDVLQVLQQHNARVNKQGVAAAQQRLREHKAPQAAAAQFCAAGEAARAAAPASTQGGGDESDEQLLALLKQHNAKVGGEPRRRVESTKASVTAMRAWESRSGRTFASLSYEERVAANDEIRRHQQLKEQPPARQAPPTNLLD